MNTTRRLLLFISIWVYVVESEYRHTPHHTIMLPVQKQNVRGGRTSFQNSIRNFGLSCLRSRNAKPYQQPKQLNKNEDQNKTNKQIEPKVVKEASIDQLLCENVQDQETDLLQIAQEYLLTPLDDDSIHDQRLIKRAKGIYQTFNYECVTNKRYACDKKLSNSLEAYAIELSDLEQCNGTEIQHVLHSELVQIVHELFLDQSPLYSSSLSVAARESSSLALQANKTGYIKQTIALTDFCWAVVECMKGAVEGVYDAVNTTAHMLAHPIETSYKTAQIIVTVGNTFANLLAEVGFLAYMSELDPQQAQTKIRDNVHALAEIISDVYTQIAEMSARETTREITSCITEAYLCSKVLSMGTKFFGSTKQKVCNAVQRAAQESAVAPVLATAEGIDIAIGSETASVLLSAIEGGSTKTPAGTGSFKRFVKLFVPPKENIKHLKNMFQKVKSPLEVNGEFLTFNFEHFLYPDITRMIQKSGRIRDKFAGFHHDYLGKVEKSKMIEVIKERIIFLSRKPQGFLSLGMNASH